MNDRKDLAIIEYVANIKQAHRTEHLKLACEFPGIPRLCQMKCKPWGMLGDPIQEVEVGYSFNLSTPEKAGRLISWPVIALESQRVTGNLSLSLVEGWHYGKQGQSPACRSTGHR